MSDDLGEADAQVAGDHVPGGHVSGDHVSGDDAPGHHAPGHHVLPTAERQDRYIATPEQTDILLRAATWNRYAALGDSMAEGILEPLDGYDPTCWADRIAAALRRVRPGLAYLNTGRRGQLSTEVRETQLGKVLDFGPDLVTVVCGGNDILAPAFDPDVYRENLDAMVGALAGAGATIFLYSLMDITAGLPELAGIRPRLEQLNDATHQIARGYGTIWVELWAHPAAGDRDAYSSDRMHMSARGHGLIATRTIEELGHHLETGRTRPGETTETTGIVEAVALVSQDAG
ncbi:SGNH/GDSL hydrolase family protein [Frankia sp. R43]|uniref:SGNH/GDSL hydrolase family protein n=1 Tax=Frankia sp. R43 TaxID=269536 RepID=UPI0006CA1FF2|nr:SGNH/GDSL hydrolase family protein [Frankia sp. R43]